MNLNLAAIVIIYNPDTNIHKNISSFIEYVDKVVVFDNSEEKDLVLIEQLLANKKIKYIHDGNNLGIAARLNEALVWANANNFDWLLLMDQDSYFLRNDFSVYIKSVEAYKNINEVAVFGSLYGTVAERDFKITAEKEDTSITNLIITSGSLLNIKLNNEIGEFDENLFIDLVDYDYCLRARKMGFLNVRINKSYLVHRIGITVNKATIKSLYLKKKQKVIHKADRWYYLTRNLLYIQKKHGSIFNNEITALKKRQNDYFSTCLFYGNEPIELIKNIWKGKLDFKKNKMGKRSS